MTAPDISWSRRGWRVLIGLLAIFALAIAAERIVAALLADRVERWVVAQLETALRIELESAGIEWSLGAGKLALRDASLRAPLGSAFRFDAEVREEPLLGFERIEVEVEWGGLLDRELNLALEVDGLRAFAARDRDGSSNWEGLGAAPDAPVDGPLDELADGSLDASAAAWTVAIVSLTVRDAKIFVVTDAIRDFVPVEIAVPELRLRGDAWRFGDERNTASGSLRVDGGGGPLDLAFEVTHSDEGWFAEVDFVGRNLEVGPRQAPFEGLGTVTAYARVDMDLHYTLRPGGEVALTGDAELSEATFKATHPPHSLEVDKLRLVGLAIDMEDLRLEVARAEAEGGSLRIASLLDVEAAANSQPGGDVPAWGWRIGQASVQGLDVESRLPDGSLRPLGRVARFAGSDLGSYTDAAGAFELMGQTHGGSLSAEGRMSGRPHSLTAEASWQAIELASLWPAAPASRLAVESGTTSGSLSLRAFPALVERAPDAPWLEVVGAFRLQDARLRANSARGFAVLELPRVAVEDARLDWPVSSARSDPTDGPHTQELTSSERVAIRLGRMTVDGPRLDVARLAIVESEPEGSADAASPVSVQLGEIAFQGGRVRMSDQTFDPTLQLGFNEVSGRAIQAAWPAGFIESLKVDATPLGRGSLTLSGSRTPAASGLVVDARRVAGVLVNGPAREMIGYELKGGRLSLRSQFEFLREHFESRNRLVLHAVQVRAASEDRPVDKALGMSLDAALTVLRDANGDVTLNVPVSGNRSEVRVASARALQEAFLANVPTALAASPLKFAEGIRAGTHYAFGRIARVTGIDVSPVLSDALAGAGLKPADADRVVGVFELDLAADGVLLTEQAWLALNEIGHELVAHPEIQLILLPSRKADPALADALVEHLTVEFLFPPSRVKVAPARSRAADARRAIQAVLWTPRDARPAAMDGAARFVPDFFSRSRRGVQEPEP